MRRTSPVVALAVLLVLPAIVARGDGPLADRAGPARADEPPRRAGFLVVDGVYNSELMAPYDIFHHTVFHTDPGMEVFVVSPDGEPVVTFEGLTIEAHFGFADAPAIDILVVPSAEHSMDTDLENAVMIDWVRRVGRQAEYLLSLCDGAFVLARAGLLDGLASTTFPGDVDAYERMFPQLDVRRGVSFVHHGKAVTAQGGAKSYAPALYLVELLYGIDVATGVGKGMVIDWPAEAPESLVVTDTDAENRETR